MDKTERVKRLKEHLNISVEHEKIIMNCSTLKEANIYCVIHGISSQKYGSILEKYIRLKYNYIQNKSKDCIGDCSKDGINTEIKVSLGGATHNKFNFVQIRPGHECETYILTAYHLTMTNVEMEGELYIFRISKPEIKKILVLYGGYAHGTIKEHGIITADSLNDEKKIKEYALRPTFNGSCWKKLLLYRITESEL